MGITIGYSGRIPLEGDLAALRVFLRDYARDMLWRAEPLEKTIPRARLGQVPLELAAISGLVLIPHFACEPVPILRLQGTGDLCDLEMLDHGDGAPVELTPQVFVKTQFAGPEVHVEVLDFLLELKRACAPDLVIEDETDYFTHRNARALQDAFDASWQQILRSLQTLEPSRSAGPLTIGGFEVYPCTTPLSGDPCSTLSVEHKALIAELTKNLQAEFGGFGLDLREDRGGLEDLDLLMGELDGLHLLRRGDRTEADRLVHQIGATFGSAIAKELGGQWKIDEEQGLVLENVGGVGLLVNPFQVAAERVAFGPSHGFENHFGAWSTLVRHLHAARLTH